MEAFSVIHAIAPVTGQPAPWARECQHRGLDRPPRGAVPDGGFVTGEEEGGLDA